MIAVYTRCEAPYLELVPSSSWSVIDKLLQSHSGFGKFLILRNITLVIQFRAIKSLRLWNVVTDLFLKTDFVLVAGDNFVRKLTSGN